MNVTLHYIKLSGHKEMEQVAVTTVKLVLICVYCDCISLHEGTEGMEEYLRNHHRKIRFLNGRYR